VSGHGRVVPAASGADFERRLQPGRLVEHHLGEVTGQGGRVQVADRSRRREHRRPVLSRLAAGQLHLTGRHLLPLHAGGDSGDERTSAHRAPRRPQHTLFDWTLAYGCLGDSSEIILLHKQQHICYNHLLGTLVCYSKVNKCMRMKMKQKFIFKERRVKIKYKCCSLNSPDFIFKLINLL